MPKQQPRPVFTVEGKLTITDSTAKVLFTLPRGARIVALECYTAATATSGTLDVGVAGNTDEYVDGLDVSVKQVKGADLLVLARTTTKQDVYGLIGGAPGSGGPFTVIAYFDTDRSRGPSY